MPLSWSKQHVSTWGMVSGGSSEVLYPTDAVQVQAAFQEVAAAGETLGLRGAGCSYGDASLNSKGRLLDFSRMDRILSFDEVAGEALAAQAGVPVLQ